MPVDATPETYKEPHERGEAFADFWGPRCQPCLAMMPTITTWRKRPPAPFASSRSTRLRTATSAASLVFGLPTYILMRDGKELARSARCRSSRWRKHSRR